MNHEHRQQFCMKCLNRQLDRKNGGWACKLSGKQPEFDETCPDFSQDEDAAKRLEVLENQEIEIALESETGGLHQAGIKNGVVAGFLFILGAIVWFVAGIVFLDRIFFYPIAMVIIGIGLIIKSDKKNKP